MEKSISWQIIKRIIGTTFQSKMLISFFFKNSQCQKSKPKAKTIFEVVIQFPEVFFAFFHHLLVAKCSPGRYNSQWEYRQRNFFCPRLPMANYNKVEEMLEKRRAEIIRNKRLSSGRLYTKVEIDYPSSHVRLITSYKKCNHSFH